MTGKDLEKEVLEEIEADDKHRAMEIIKEAKLCLDRQTSISEKALKQYEELLSMTPKEIVEFYGLKDSFYGASCATARR